MGPPSSTDAELRARARQQGVVADLGQQALATNDLDRLLRAASEGVADGLDVEYCHVLELQPDDELRLRQGVGWRTGLVGSATVPTALDAPAGYALRTGEPVVVNDLRADERFPGRGRLASHGIVGGISVVVGPVDDPWGVLEAHATERRTFTEEDARFVESVANVLAGAIDRTETERQLREREAQLNVATASASIGLWTWDVREDVVTADEFLAESYGKDPDAITGGAPMEAFYEPILEEDREETWAALDRALETGELEAEYRVRGADGEIMWVVARGAVEYGDDGEPLRMHGAVADITERKRREQALREREQRYRDLFTSMSEGYCVIERVDTPPGEPIDFQYVEANPAFEANTGIEGVVGKTIRDVVPDTPKEWIDTYDRVVRTGEPVRFERELVAQERILDVYAFPVGDETDEQVGVVFTDVTERVERERRLEELVEKLEASNERLEQFAYAASHDLQEPLRMVSSYLRLVEDRYAEDLDEDAEEFIDFAVDGAERMRAMIDGLLEYSRVESRGDPFEPVDLDEVVADVLADLQLRIDEHDATIDVADLPRVQGDRGQLRQLFQNLLDNAIKYGNDEPPKVHVSAERDGREWIVSVRDEGIGIDPEQAERVFEVFQRLHVREEHEGTGIGLALCRRIVERHGGDIWVESEPGEGATFSFTLPAVDEPAG